MEKNSGFTIMEILIVLAVIAVLMAVAIPRFRGLQMEAWRSKAQGDLVTLKAAIESYKMNNAGYPVETPGAGKTISTGWQAALTAAKPAMISNALNDPFSGGGSTPYRYVLSADDANKANFYLVWSVGPDGSTSITGIDDTSGAVTGAAGDDLIETNGK